QRRGDLRADKPSADDCEALALLGQRAQLPIIVERAIVYHVIATPREAARGAAGRQEQLIKAVFASLVVGYAFVLYIERLRLPSKQQIETLLWQVHPHALQLRAFPER